MTTNCNEHLPLAQLLQAAERGDRQAHDRLFAGLYDELKRLAQRELRRSAMQSADIGSTTLVHELYAALSEREQLAFPDKARFLAYAARAMRGFIIDSIRSRSAVKRGGEFHITQLNTQIADSVAEADRLSQISDALEDLAAVDPRLAEVVDLKYFCGFSLLEIAALRQVGERTVQRDWERARILLYESLRDVKLD